MKAPDKIYVREYPDGLNQFWNRKKRDDVVATIHHEYIRKDALLEWAKDMKTETEDVVKQHPEDESLWAEMHWWEVVIAKINAM